MNVLVVTQLFMTLNDLKEHIVERDSLTLVFANKHLNVNRSKGSKGSYRQQFPLFQLNIECRDLVRHRSQVCCPADL